MPALDGLRGIAVLVVVAFHVGGFLTGPNSRFVAGGALGVDLFFVLSGLLITSLLVAETQKSGGVDFLAFYIRRVFRLIPPLVLMLSVFLVYVAVSPISLHRAAKS